MHRKKTEGVSGNELRNQLAAEEIATPIVFVTAHDNLEARAQALSGSFLIATRTDQ